MTFKNLGQELAAAFERVLPDIRFVVVETPGSVRNVDQVEQGQAEFGLSLANIAYLGYTGTLQDLSRPARNVRGVAVLHPSRVHVLVRTDSPITSIADLRGHAVAVGPLGSGTAETSRLLLRAFDVPLDRVEEFPLSYADAERALARGDVQAAFVVAADPVDAVSAPARAGARLLDISGPVALRLRTDYPFLRTDVIPAHTYDGQAGNVRTLGIDVVLLCRADLDEVLVRRVTAALFDVLPDLAAHLDYLRLMELRRVPATPIPLHPGAAWYYRERELAR